MIQTGVVYDIWLLIEQVSIVLSAVYDNLLIGVIVSSDLV